MAAYYTCLFKNSFPWLIVLGFFFAFAHSSGIGFLTIFLTSSALILSPVIVSRSKPSCREDSPRVSSEEVVSEQKSEVNQVKIVANLHEQVLNLKRVDDIIIQKTGEKKDNVNGYLLCSSDALSDSESHDHTSSSDESSDNDWIFRENIISHRKSFSDGSISDEESLIEIALPTGHYLEPKRCSDCSLESHFRQQTLMEMLSEMNEENLIEIDICMGSIKCSRFGIQA